LAGFLCSPTWSLFACPTRGNSQRIWFAIRA
jgi:hypothetical protein